MPPTTSKSRSSKKSTSARSSSSSRSGTSRSTVKSPSQIQADARESTQKLVDKEADGWNVFHAQPARTVEAPGAAGTSTVVVSAANYVAHKRDGNSLIEVQGDTPEQLAERIADWERSRFAAEPAVPTEEQLMNDAKATLHMAVTAGARQAVDVDLTPAAAKPKAKATRLVAHPPIDEVKLTAEDQQMVADRRATDTTGQGVGTGTGTPAPAAKP